ncbi:hypothetical protein FPQ18DRAFT_251106 [Pyronema domesticum]|uniref:Uncharacterized protein n=1 Tax=Pyronema omphalodes (strain CBS 100304) TaxID=1076935 RepID=U4LRW2_PYROM|nr:hypothetical protein FPQ18DRAFT_251106 [Pyronema domesticum]CCX34916.1 Similar to hypothetical protein NECHADRAFT_102844 [Nectria haematococca mpVI 77-13-4]; acc. no. XP_003050195 [Pyronema omphalodes CBS 100304]
MPRITSNSYHLFRYGWAALIVAGGGAYIFARRDIDASRRQKALDLRRRRHEQRAAEFDYRADNSISTSFNPASEASQDPAATRHEPRPGEKSKFEANKGEDR